MNMKLIQTKTARLTAAMGLFASIGLPVLLASQAGAATLSQVMVRFDRMQTSTTSSGMVCAMPATTSTDVKSWTVTFPAGYTVSGTAANWQTANISTSNLPSGASAWPNATSATAAVGGQTVTWTNAAAQTMNAATLYCYNWTLPAALTISAAATSSNSGSVATLNSSAATIDSGTYSTASITGDQITVSATVPQTFSFALNASTDSLGTLSTGSVAQSAGVTATVNTNAKNGFKVWAKDVYAGIRSTSASKTIAAANGPLVANTEGYNLGVTVTQTSGAGTPSATAPFAGGAAGVGGALATTFAEIGSSAGTANNAVFTLRNSAAIDGTTPAAADYTDTITVVGAGLF